MDIKVIASEGLNYLREKKIDKVFSGVESEFIAYTLYPNYSLFLTFTMVYIADVTPNDEIEFFRPHKVLQVACCSYSMLVLTGLLLLQKITKLH